MSSLPTPPRLGARVPLPPPPRDNASAGSDDSNAELTPGDLLEGRYQVEERIGEGGVGFVYRALQLKLHRRVAVKLLQQDVVGEEELRPRFQQEALTLAALSHPHIVSLVDYGVVRGRPFLVMELLEGRTLRELLDDEGHLTPGRALTLVRQLVLALTYAHSLGIVHRDLKPANLIVQALPSYEHVKVLDFGMVKLLPGSYLHRGEQLTRVGFTFGTPAYMSPEHAMGGDVDGRSDIYSVGVLLYELLTGEKPFDGEVQDILRHHLATPVPRIEEKRPELAAYPELQQLIDRAMAKERDERFADATSLLQAVDELLLSGLMADADREGAAAADAGRPSMGPKMREALESAGAALSSYARASQEFFRHTASPQIVRANRELRALAARLAPKLRTMSQQAWGKLRPQLLSAAHRITELALEAKQRLKSSDEPRLALPADVEPKLPDKTVIDVPTFARDQPEIDVTAPAKKSPEAANKAAGAANKPVSAVPVDVTDAVFAPSARADGAIVATLAAAAQAPDATIDEKVPSKDDA